MPRINILVPRLYERKYSGGIWCIFEYAHGLHKRGHDVTIIPILSSPEPKWFDRPVGRVITNPAKQRIRALANSTGVAFRDLLREGKQLPKSSVRELLFHVADLWPAILSHPVQMGLAEESVLRTAPEADINIATSFETVRPACLLKGRGVYFTQHFEPYFTDDYPMPSFAKALAISSYRPELQIIANSPWLKDRIESEVPGTKVDVCPNAISHATFHGSPREAIDSKRVVVISYGGRDAVWKGFREMAEAVAIARSTLTDYDIEWRVFGECLLEPQNNVASYFPLGFLNPSKLSEEYQKADLLLSASWYESFPLFPLEAMACGCPVVTTQAGTEEYAVHRLTAEIVEPRSPQQIAFGLIRTITDYKYRSMLSRNGLERSRQFTWERSVDRLEALITKPTPNRGEQPVDLPAR